MTSPFSTLLLWNLPLVNATTRQVRNHLTKALSDSKSSPVFIATPNPEQIILAEKTPAFKSNLAQFDLLLPDGIGLVLASRYFRTRRQLPKALSERITGSDLADQLLRYAKETNKTALIIGGFYADLAHSSKKNKNDIEKHHLDYKTTNQTAFEQRLPLTNQTLPYWTEGYHNTTQLSQIETNNLKNLIQYLKPALILVAFGAPFQEQWLIENRSFLIENGVKVALTVGGSIDFLTGKKKRAPVFLQKIHLEWLYRLIQEPSRFRRQLALIKFIALTLKTSPSHLNP